MNISFKKDLEQRTNTEKSRNFNSIFWKNHLKYLSRIYGEIQKQFLFYPIKISIVGTNGKGTTGFFLQQILYQTQKSVGLYSSPHLISYTERINVNLKTFSEQELEKEYQDFYRFLNRNGKEILSSFQILTYFELLTIFSIFIFYKYKIQVQIYEAGLGGKYDATKIIQPDYVILTNIRMDHTKVLGTTKQKILKEKLGIINKNTKILIVGESELKPYIEQFKYPVQVFYFSHQPKRHHQSYLETLKEFSLFCFRKIFTTKPIPKKTLKNLKKPPAREEIHTIKNQYWIFDTAHNISAMYFFLISLSHQFSDMNPQNSIWFVGVLKDRDYKHIFRLWKWTKISYRIPSPKIPDFSEFIHPYMDRKYSSYIVNTQNIKTLTERKKYIIFCGSFRFYHYFLSLLPDI